MSAENLWTHVGALVGKTMVTLDRSSAFEIIAVDDEAVIVKPLTSKERVISRAEVDQTWQELVRQGELSEKAIRAGFSEYNPTYVAALLAAVPDVTYAAGSTRLYYGSK